MTHFSLDMLQAAFVCAKAGATMDWNRVLPTRMVPRDDVVFVQFADFDSGQTTWVAVMESPRGYVARISDDAEIASI